MVTGIKKKGDFTAQAIIRCYEKLMDEGFYKSFGALIGSFEFVTGFKKSDMLKYE